MYSREHIKFMAKTQISGKIGILFLCNLIFVLCTAACSVPVVGYIGGLVALPVVEFGLTRIYLNVTKGIDPTIEEIFTPFKYEKMFLRSLGIYWLTALYTFLWSLLFVIPGIIKGISYSMAPYILIDNPQFTVKEAIDESQRIMMGHKGDYFILGLSFIGWMILTAITSGLVGIYAIPYMEVTFANFYNTIKNSTYDTNNTWQ